MGYKWCMVPQCTSTSIKTPHKLFVSVPSDCKMRKKWLQVARRNPNEISEASKLYACEDHFNVQKDWANWMKFKMGYTRKIILTPGCLPSKFDCQENHRKRLDAANDFPLALQHQSGTSKNDSTSIQIQTSESNPVIETHFQVIKEEFIETEIITDLIIKEDPLLTVETEISRLKPTEKIEDFTEKDFFTNIIIKDEPLPAEIDIIQPKTLEKRMQSGYTSIQCKFCSKHFTSNSKLLRHERVHTGEKPFKCKFCSKPFSQRSTAITHERIHTDETPFKCKYCSKSFTFKGVLRVHEKIHTVDKPFKCQFCGKCFRRQGGLTVHESIHTGGRLLPCKVCKKLIIHENEFTNDEGIQANKIIKCNFCRYQSIFATHETIRIGEKPLSLLPIVSFLD